MEVGDMGVLGDFRDFGGIYREHCLCFRSFVARLALLMSSRKVDIIAISSHENRDQNGSILKGSGRTSSVTSRYVGKILKIKRNMQLYL